MRIVLSFILSFAFCSISYAQNILSDIRKDVAGKGHITVTQSEDIEKLIVEPKTDVPSKDSNKSNHTSEGSTTTPGGNTDGGVSGNAGSATAGNTTVTVADEPAAEMRKVPSRTYKATGYRIQVYTGGNKRSDKEKCEEIARRLKASIPGLPVYVHFYSPSWKCRAGNFTSQEEAHQVLQQVKNLGYSQACLVKGTINVAY